MQLFCIISFQYGIFVTGKIGSNPSLPSEQPVRRRLLFFVQKSASLRSEITCHEWRQVIQMLERGLTNDLIVLAVVAYDNRPVVLVEMDFCTA